MPKKSPIPLSPVLKDPSAASNCPGTGSTYGSNGPLGIIGARNGSVSSIDREVGSVPDPGGDKGASSPNGSSSSIISWSEELEVEIVERPADRISLCDGRTTMVPSPALRVLFRVFKTPSPGPPASASLFVCRSMCRAGFVNNPCFSSYSKF